jgi:L-lactate dehydrogenase complex protein LldG
VSSQDAFLARVRRALRKDAVPTAVRPPLLFEDGQMPLAVATLQERLIRQRQALVRQLQQELTAVGGAVTCVASAAEATAYIRRLAQEKNASLVVRWQSELLQTLEVDATLRAQGVSVHIAEAPAGTMTHAAPLAARRQELRALLARADFGLSGVDCVIAETGTLALSACPGQMRGVSLVPPVHVAVARAEQIVATLADYLLLLRAANADVQQHLTSCIAFITGPSRTGDIELTLTIGVHGPGELHLVILDESQ